MFSVWRYICSTIKFFIFIFFIRVDLRRSSLQTSKEKKKRYYECSGPNKKSARFSFSDLFSSESGFWEHQSIHGESSEKFFVGSNLFLVQLSFFVYLEKVGKKGHLGTVPSYQLPRTGKRGGMEREEHNGPHAPSSRPRRPNPVRFLREMFNQIKIHRSAWEL